MAQYTVRHQCDKLCRNCRFYDLDIFQDSFGPVINNYCEKSHYEHVGYNAKACKDFVSRQNERRHNV